MSYVGGKARGASHIIAALNHPCFDGWSYVEPFCGMAHVLRRVHKKSSYAASDAHPLLMALLTGVQHGKSPPEVSRERYYELKGGAKATALERGTACFVYSYNGKAWGSYTALYRGRGGRVDDIVGARRRYLTERLASAPAFRQATLRCAGFADALPPAPRRRTLVYCDPPYAGTLGYRGTTFDRVVFWDAARAWSRTAVVLVSEYDAPRDWRCIAEKCKASTLAGAHRASARVERLFVHESCLRRLPPELRGL
jgi:DNA adenine methylase